MADDLVVFGTDTIKFFLVDASDITDLGCYLPCELRDRAASLLGLGWIPYKSLMSICEELKATLRMLTELTGWEYTEARALLFLQDQIYSGLHVVLVMFIGYLVGYAASRFLFNNNPIMNVAAGILGSWIGVRRVA